MAKVVCVLYPDPLDGSPSTYARDGVPDIARYPSGQTTPTPSSIDFTPGQLLGSVSGALGLRSFLEASGHTFVVTSDKDGPESEFERELVDADVVISQPFWPAYLTAERIAKAPKLRLAITAGIGSDHVDLQAATAAGLTVAEVTYSNSISVAEHVVMMILALVRNYLPSHGWVIRGGWNIADCVERSYDLEGMSVGTVAAGRIGLSVLRRLKPFDVDLHYTEKHRLPADVERELDLTFHPDAASMVPECDVVTINAPLHPETENLFDETLLSKMRRGAYLVNTARAKICDRDAVVRALERPAGGLRRRRVVPAAGATRAPVADDAARGHDAAHLRVVTLGTGPLCGRHEGDPGMLLGRSSHPGGVSDRARGPARGRRRTCLHRRKRHDRSRVARRPLSEREPRHEDATESGSTSRGCTRLIMLPEWSRSVASTP